MNFKLLKVTVGALVISVTGFVNATIIYGSNSALTAYDGEETFTSNLADNTIITNQFTFLTFTPLSAGAVRYNGCGTNTWNGRGSMSGDTINTYGPGCFTNSVDDSFSLLFGVTLSAMTFDLFDEGSEAPSFWDAYLDGVLVESFGGTSQLIGGQLAFKNILFNEVRHIERQTSDYSIIDNVRWRVATAVPEPSTLAIFALGVMGLASRRFKKHS